MKHKLKPLGPSEHIMFSCRCLGVVPSSQKSLCHILAAIFILTSTFLFLSINYPPHPVLIPPALHFFTYLCQMSISFSFGPRLPTPALVLSLQMVLRFCCETCGWGKKNLFCAKTITYHFSVLVLSPSRWICSQQRHRVSLEMIFFIASQGLSGAMLRAQPFGSLSLSSLRFRPRPSRLR